MRFICQVCSKEFSRSPKQITSKNCGKTCSLECKNKYFRGKNSSWWNRQHTDESKKRISIARKGMNLGNKNSLGYKHTEEARKCISEASKKMWKLNREKMLASLPRGENSHLHKMPELRRHRKQFSALQRREWKNKNCFYCESDKHLELDHIIPIFDGGTNDRANAQTLCRGCNLFKSHYVDRPRYFARVRQPEGLTCNPTDRIVDKTEQSNWFDKATHATKQLRLFF